MTQPQKPLPPSTNAPTASTNPASLAAEHTPYSADYEAEAVENARELAVAVIAAAIKRTPRDNETPAKGVVLMTGTDPSIVAVAVAALANGIHTDNAIADMPVCPLSTIMFLHSSGSREAASVAEYAGRDIQSGNLALESIDCRRINPLAPEGVHLVTSRLQPGTCILITADYVNLKRDDAIVALTDLNAEADKHGALVVIYVRHTKKQDVSWLRNHCAVVLEVSKCEAGPGAPVAVVLDNLTLASDHVLGVGRVMIEAFREPDGGWTYRAEPFIAERAVIRLAWYLAYEGMKLREIAKVVGIYASNVSRGLQPLSTKPNNAIGIAPPLGWRIRWASWYDLNVQDAKAKPKPAGAPPNTAAPQDTSPKDANVSMPRSTDIGNEPTKPGVLSNTRRNRML